MPDTTLLNQTLGIIKLAKFSVHMISHGLKTFFFTPAFEALADTAQNKLWALQQNSNLNCLVEIMMTMNSGFSMMVSVTYNFILFFNKINLFIMQLNEIYFS